MGNIIIGTSGYFFPDWYGTFYPKGLKRDLWLKYYAMHFQALELNTTFYAIPKQDVIEKLINQVPENFQLIIKTPQVLTHREASSEDIRTISQKFQNSISPAIEKGIFNGYLIQFPESFYPNRTNFKRVVSIAEFLSGPLFIEFRNILWKNQNNLKFMKDNRISWVIPDSPRLGKLMTNKPIITTDKSYLRLHGRNNKTWYGKGNRYDYSYSNEEMLEIFDLVKLLSSRSRDVYVFFNNCHNGQAAMNAIKLSKLFGATFPQQELF